MSREVSINGQTFREGDVLVEKRTTGKYLAVKILVIDEVGKNPDGEMLYIFHQAMWNDFDEKPTLDEIRRTDRFIWHVSISRSATSPLEETEIIGNIPVETDELMGFHEYLKNTNLKRYIEETGQDMDVYIGSIQDMFTKANAASETKDFEKAIDLYTKVLDMFPSYWEALDNRAFAKMDLGKYEDAIVDFKRSLEIHPSALKATFSIGECHLRLGRKNEAHEWINKASAIAPQDPMVQKWLTAFEKSDSQDRKAWWKLW